MSAAHDRSVTRHRVLLCWEPEAHMLLLVCWGCGRAVFSAPENQAEIMWSLMHDINARGGLIA